ncbi:MAG: response regulator transcription factor [Candidatus Marinarcus sp.]|uniref:response regulator transcription factor n=1 Tax=Candidatus Marinarcus sp. TaxID=3100987 RepID=UPI003AFF92C2
MKILLIEDDEKISNFLKKGLEEELYSVDTSYQGDEGLYLAQVNVYDLIILDIMLPKLNGLEVCKQLRASHVHTPIIMLSAKESIDDKITGLNAGANDYLPKPFSFAELLARIRVQLREKNIQQNELTIDDLKLNLLTKSVQRAGQNIALTAKELSLLEFLMRNENKVLSETMINSSLSNLNESNMSNVVNVFIYRLRNKIDKPYKKKLIKTIRGIGFKMSSEDE